MSIPRFRVAVLFATALAACLVWMPAAARAQSGVERKLTVGIFNRILLVQAYYRSAAWRAKMQELMNTRNDAALGSDSLKVEQLDKQLAAMQTLAQEQLAGAAPLTNIYDALKGEWPEIAREANVDVIVEPPLYLVPGSVLVDITPQVIRHLNKGG